MTHSDRLSALAEAPEISPVGSASDNESQYDIVKVEYCKTKSWPFNVVFRQECHKIRLGLVMDAVPSRAKGADKFCYRFPISTHLPPPGRG